MNSLLNHILRTEMRIWPDYAQKYVYARLINEALVMAVNLVAKEYIKHKGPVVSIAEPYSTSQLQVTADLRCS